jgi:hypothetical protein
VVQEKHVGSYIHNTIKVIKSWLAHNGIELKRKIEITGVREAPTLKEERVPTKENSDASSYPAASLMDGEKLTPDSASGSPANNPRKGLQRGSC